MKKGTTMVFVKFTGRANERVLTAADFHALGVEDTVTKTTFIRGAVTEVSEAVATVLTKDPRVSGSFELISTTEAPAEVAPLVEVVPPEIADKKKEKVDKPS